MLWESGVQPPGARAFFACQRSQKMFKITSHRLYIVHNHRSHGIEFGHHRYTQYLSHRSRTYFLLFANHIVLKSPITGHGQGSCTPPLWYDSIRKCHASTTTVHSCLLCCLICSQCYWCFFKQRSVWVLIQRHFQVKRTVNITWL